jgi:DNA-directed RNA polymerase subunit RPC12/RpoP
VSKKSVNTCPYCGSANTENSEKEVKCFDCGMGKYKDSKHKT